MLPVLHCTEVSQQTEKGQSRRNGPLATVGPKKGGLS
jgi:hypothetical protein